MRYLGTMAATVGLATLGFAGLGNAWGQDSPVRDADPIARVNGQPILSRDFNLAVQIQFRRRGPGQRGLPDLRAVRERALDSLIDNELLSQQASSSAIKVGDDEIERELARVQETFGSRENLDEVLQASGVSFELFREQIRRSIVIVRFVERQVVGDIDVTEQDVRRYYDTHPDEMMRRDAVRISQIVIKVPENASSTYRAAARTKIERILDELRAGKDFAEMARAHSDGVEAQRGGDSGTVTRDGGALPPVETAALQLQPGEMSDIVESQRGFHIIKATARQPGGVIPFEEAREEIESRLASRRREERVTEYLAGLKKKARIEKNLPGSS